MIFGLLLGREPEPELRMRWEDAGANFGREELIERVVRSPEFCARFAVQQPPRSRLIEVAGIAYAIDPRDSAVAAEAATGRYAPHVCRAIETHLRPGAVMLDIGANVGILSLIGARRVGPSGRVVAVEPLDKNVQLLCQSACHNGLANVEVWPVAASDRSRLVAMSTHESTSNAEVSLTRRGDEALLAQAVPLDPWLAAFGRLDLVKIDVEGHEPLALAGMLGALRRFRPTLVSEFHPTALRANAQVEPAKYLALLFGLWQHVLVIAPDREPQPCSNGSEVLAIWSRAAAERGQGIHLDLLCLGS